MSARRRWLATAVVSLLVLQGGDVAFAAERVTLRTDSPTITLTQMAPVQFRVYSGEGVPPEADLYINSNLDFTNVSEGYVISSVERESNYYLISIEPNDPVQLGSFPLEIQDSSSEPLKMTVVIAIDAMGLKLYSLDFRMSCENSYYGEFGSCLLEPSLKGAGRNLVSGLFITTFSIKTKSASKWSSFKPFKWPINKRVQFSLIKTKQQFDVKADIIFEGKSYTMTSYVLPIARLTVTAPNATFVGANFNLVVKSNAPMSGNCVVGSTNFRLNRGYAKISLYGKVPGDLPLYVTCNGPGWAPAYGYKFVYVRS